MHAHRIHILHPIEKQTCRRRNKSTYRPHMLYFWTIKKNPHRQWHQVQKQTLDRSIRKTKNTYLFTPIYSPQCNGRIEGFHKFLKATIAKQLETRVEWDDLVWKATAAYNFFPTESSGLAPFFLMFGHETAVKHTLHQLCKVYLHICRIR